MSELASSSFYSPLPLPQLDHHHKSLSHKKCLQSNKEYTPVRQPPRAPTKSAPPVSRLFTQKHNHLLKSRPQSVTFFASPELSRIDQTYNEKDNTDYFRQCFHINSLIGSGSFGDVFRVTARDTGKHFAVKKSRERFKNDADRIRRLDEVRKFELTGNHENCVGFVCGWEEVGFLYIQQELCRCSLTQHCLSLSASCLSEAEVWDVITDMLNALSHLHSRSLIHLDIKPANIFIGYDYLYKLGDFGLVLVKSQSPVDGHVDAQEGDPAYLAPELLQGRFDFAADVFSLGTSLLECSTGIDLPRGGPWWHTLRSDISKIPFEFRSSVSSELWNLISLMMAPDHLKRITVDEIRRLNCVVEASKIRPQRLSEARLTSGSPLKELFIQSCDDSLSDISLINDNSFNSSSSPTFYSSHDQSTPRTCGYLSEMRAASCDPVSPVMLNPDFNFCSPSANSQQNSPSSTHPVEDMCTVTPRKLLDIFDSLADDDSCEENIENDVYMQS